MLMGMRLAGVILLIMCFNAIAQQDELQPLPKILSLPKALELLDQSHPQFLLGRAKRAALEAEQVVIDANKDLQSSIILNGRSVDRLADSGHNFVDDSRAIFVVDKPILDFGRSTAFNSALQDDREALEIRQQNDYVTARVKLIEAFFAVIVADYHYAAVDEEMTLTYLAFDDAREKMELYQEVAQIEVRRLEALYLSALARRLKASQNQRARRLQLALALGRPDSYPDLLEEPDLSYYDRAAPDYIETVNQVLSNHPSLVESRLQLSALEQRANAESLWGRPTLGTRFEATEYNQIFGSSRDQFRASLYLNIPLVAAPTVRARQAGLHAKRQQHEAELALNEYKIRSQVLENIQQLEALESEMAAAEAVLLHRELELDKVRLQYEMEVRVRIGSAMYDMASAIHHLAKVRYQRALAWEYLDAMLGITDSYSKKAEQ